MHRHGRVVLHAAVGGVLAFGAARGAAAQETLSDSIERFLENADRRIEETRLWRFHVRPSLRESVIWTDNVYLNADDEEPVRLLRVTTPGGRVITDPTVLRGIRSTLPDFGSDSRRRVDDFLIQSELTVGLELPVNEEYSKLFEADHLTILEAQVRNQEYLDENDLDNTSLFLNTDLFGMVSDIFSVDWGNSFWVRVSDEYSQLKDPLDARILLLRQQGVTTVSQFEDFGREENTARFDTGYEGARFDGSVGYENYHLWLDDDELSQAEHTRHNWHAEVGADVPGMSEKRAFLRYDFWMYRFARAPVFDVAGRPAGSIQVLNNADVHRWLVGLEGPFLGDKLRARAEAGYLWWDADESGAASDDNKFSGAVGALALAYQPWTEEEGRKTSFNARYERSVAYSAISNYNAEHQASLSVLHEIVPRRLEVDATFAYTRTEPSDGPNRHLYEAGLGLVYHLYPQLDLSFRYLLRWQISTDEIVTASAFARGGRLVEYQVRSDGDFYQNILELGIELHF